MVAATPMVDVVPARYDHLPAVTLLFRRLAAERAEARYPMLDDEEFENFLKVMAARIDEDHATACCLVAVHEGKLLGFASAQLAGRPIGKPHTFAFYEWIGVTDGARRLGIGRDLILAVVDWAEARGVSTIEGNATSATAPDWVRRGFHDTITRGVITTAEARATLLVPSQERPPVGASSTEPVTGEASVAAPPKRKRKTIGGRKARLNGAAEGPMP